MRGVQIVATQVLAMDRLKEVRDLGETPRIWDMNRWCGARKMHELVKWQRPSPLDLTISQYERSARWPRKPLPLFRCGELRPGSVVVPN
jgi:hypothetical protein